MTGINFIKIAQDILNHPKFPETKSTIFDHTDLDFQNTCLKDLETIRSFHLKNDQKIGPGRSAMVVGKGRLKAWHDLWSSGEKAQVSNEVKVFEETEEALNWIGIPT